MSGSSRVGIHHFMVGFMSPDEMGQGYDIADRQDLLAYTPGRHTHDWIPSSFRIHSQAFLSNGVKGHRLIVAHDATRAHEQGETRRARIRELEAMGETTLAKLNRQDEGQSAKGRRASDREAYSRFVRAIADAELTRFIKADLNRRSLQLDGGRRRDRSGGPLRW